MWDTAQFDAAYRQGLREAEGLRRVAVGTCLKSQVEWVKAELVFDHEWSERERIMLHAILSSLENLQRRVDADVAERRKALTVNMVEDKPSDAEILASGIVHGLVNVDASSCPTCGAKDRGPGECVMCRQQRKDEEEL